MLSNIKKVTLISRPISWPNTAYPFAAAFIVSGGAVGVFFWISTLYFFIPYNLLMYGINDVFDYESDMRNPRKGGIEGAREQKELHPLIIKSAILLNLPFLIFMFAQGTIVANGILTLLIFSVVAYSIVGLRLKEVPILDSITSSIHFVGPMVYALSLTGLSMAHLPFIVAFFLWGAASHAFGAVQDILPDRQGGLSSIATVLGARFTVRLVCALYIVAGLVLLLGGGLPAIAGVLSFIYAVNAAPHFHITDKESLATNTAWRRFIWLNLFSGFVITMLIIFSTVGL